MEKTGKVVSGICGGLAAVLVAAACAGHQAPGQSSATLKAIATTAAASSASAAPAAPTVASGCAYIAQWWSGNQVTWTSIETDLSQVSTDSSNLDLSAVEADGTQLSTDVSSLSTLDQTQIPRGKNAASFVALDLAKDELALSVAGQMAANGNITQANTDINVAASSIGQTTADIKKCN
jgi:hypothetical protein